MVVTSGVAEESILAPDLGTHPTIVRHARRVVFKYNAIRFPLWRGGMGGYDESIGNEVYRRALLQNLKPSSGTREKT